MMHMIGCVQDVAENGPRQTVHVLVTTYNEPPDMVQDGVLRLLVAPEPVYMRKIIYVCDDGYASPDGPRKRAMVADLHALGVPPQTHLYMRLC